MPNGYDQDAMDARANEMCEICKARRATEWHHCLVKRKKDALERNHIWNLQHVCHHCHETEANSYRNKSAFFWQQFRKHGQPFLDWYSATAYPMLEYAEERERANAST